MAKTFNRGDHVEWNRKLKTPELRQHAIVARRAAGESLKAIAAAEGVTPWTVNRVLAEASTSRWCRKSALMGMR